jgi:hypothetical protein
MAIRLRIPTYERAARVVNHRVEAGGSIFRQVDKDARRVEVNDDARWLDPIEEDA